MDIDSEKFDKKFVRSMTVTTPSLRGSFQEWECLAYQQSQGDSTRRKVRGNTERSDAGHR
jgi:hypothetical protein